MVKVRLITVADTDSLVEGVPLHFKYQRFTPLGCKDIGSRKFEGMTSGKVYDWLKMSNFARKKVEIFKILLK